MLRRRFGLERAICVVHTDLPEPEEPELKGFTTKSGSRAIAEAQLDPKPSN